VFTGPFYLEVVCNDFCRQNACITVIGCRACFEKCSLIVLLQIILLVFQWFLTSDGLELVIKMRDIVIPTLIAYFSYILFVFYQQLAGITDTYFHQELHIGLLRFVLEETAEGRARHMQQRGYFI